MKSLFIFLSLAISFSVFAQSTIPNPNFEQWSAGNPVGWQTSNSFTQQFGATTVSQEAVNPYQGNFAVRLETKSVFGYSIAGLITNGQISVNVNQTPPVTILGGTPFTARPNRFKGYYQYQPGANDYCMIVALLLKRNQSTNTFDTVGVAQFLNTAAVNSWTLFDVPFNYALGDSPDTIQVIAISSNPDASVVGSVLLLDSLHFEGGTVSVASQWLPAKFYVWYNSAEKIITVQPSSSNADNTISIYDVLGNKVYETSLINKSSCINIPVHNWQKGIYFVNESKEKASVKKILVY